ncbi:hypothetical protein OH77DRAFT_1525873 [Trametes cingulata]|nr:hypothetical protein OH77DRAFT_1525873 [Trametes cingulata]
MSHSWSVRAYAGISEDAMTDLQKVIHLLAWWLAYDNVNFAFQVFSQRLSNQSHFDSGTSGSVFVKPHAPQPPPLSSAALQEQRRVGRQNPITLADIAALEVAAAPRIHTHIVHIVLQTLLDCPEFDLPTYPQRAHDAFAAPPPVDRLPTGIEGITKQYVLGTVHIDEASYEGTDDLIREWMHQLKLDGADQRTRTGLERVLVWVGDHLTVDRLRGLANYCCEDMNGYDRLDWLVVYFGSTKGRGLRQAFALLNRKGLQNVKIKGVFYHHLHEGILHIAEARLRDCWRKVGGVEKLSDLRSRGPEELRTLVEELVRQYASNDAVEGLEALMDGQHDETLRQSVMWNRDVLYYILLHGSMQSGDVGMMEDLLPHLLYRFAGGGNHKNFIRRNCWLVNLSGKSDEFQAIDLVEEHTIKDVKVTYRPKGPNASWQLMKARVPAIPRPAHTSPSKEADVQRLYEFYKQAGIHDYVPGRNAVDDIKEVVSNGFQVAGSTLLWRWLTRREVYNRTSSQTWEASNGQRIHVPVTSASA